MSREENGGTERRNLAITSDAPSEQARTRLVSEGLDLLGRAGVSIRPVVTGAGGTELLLNMNDPYKSSKAEAIISDDGAKAGEFAGISVGLGTFNPGGVVGGYYGGRQDGVWSGAAAGMLSGALTDAAIGAAMGAWAPVPFGPLWGAGAGAVIGAISGVMSGATGGETHALAHHENLFYDQKNRPEA